MINIFILFEYLLYMKQVNYYIIKDPPGPV